MTETTVAIAQYPSVPLDLRESLQRAADHSSKAAEASDWRYEERLQLDGRGHWSSWCCCSAR